MTNIYKRTTRTSSLKFAYPTWIVDTSWGGLIYLNVLQIHNVNALYLLIGICEPIGIVIKSLKRVTRILKLLF
jgi:hypothetical protein